MSIDITFTLSNDDLKHFEDIVGKAKAALENEESAKQVEAAAMKMVEEARGADLPAFIEERLLKLEMLINMVSDKEWELDEKERNAILSALAYFCDPNDLIPDHVPGIGFLDDAIYVEIIIQELETEISSYNEFCRYRTTEENRRRNKGLDPTVGREDWLADKRSVLHSRMRARRSGRSGGHGWRTRLF
ncbi:MAG: YkvA family protein [Gammaproteobacteria bacterium]|jgi:uncharacterized membrane protein YkvA (DUF1232 family)|nr:hypothetical protein [Gammaproteobacteria bacterium]MDP6094730.1 YkvA family protein [Gammaproteobacteria bacterium]MDP7455511.1 YkvA family protein [Gammaproteobacteria bacterium]HJO11326.1 YkvA family protein [Gammaproteobacteria bacterium]|tara:strand:+ start:925 stop:1491 length:567 start_codon:yes stop_codon:yes gene_type:complete